MYYLYVVLLTVKTAQEDSFEIIHVRSISISFLSLFLPIIKKKKLHMIIVFREFCMNFTDKLTVIKQQTVISANVLILKNTENQITIIYTAGVRKIKQYLFFLMTPESIVGPEMGCVFKGRDVQKNIYLSSYKHFVRVTLLCKHSE